MTDRELLKWAAKAAGIGLQPFTIVPADRSNDGFIGYMTDPDQWPRGWFDPLTNDGDALRLAVKLNLHVGVDAESAGTICVEWDFDGGGLARRNVTEEAPAGGDDCAATRRAIVRAAAEIGRLA